MLLDQLTSHKPIELAYFSIISSLRQQMLIENLSNGCDVVNWKWSAVVVVIVGMMSICWSSITARVWIKALHSASRRAPLRSSSQWSLKRRESLREFSTIWSRRTGLICMTAFFAIQMIGFKMKCNELKLDYISPAYVLSWQTAFTAVY